MFNLVKSNEKIIAATKSNWIEQAANLGDFGVMVADDVGNIFDRIENNTEENEHTYFLTEDDEKYGRAVLKIMHAFPFQKKQSWLKLMKIRLEPKLNLEGEEVKSSEKVSEMYLVLATAILESIGLIFTNKVNMLKIYGRTTEMKDMFVALLTDNNLKNSFLEKGLEARTEGAWLVVEKKI